MGVLQRLVIGVLSLSFLVFIALFGRLPVFRHVVPQLLGLAQRLTRYSKENTNWLSASPFVCSVAEHSFAAR